MGSYTAATVYSWAVARATPNNPGASLFYTKPTGMVSHGGGTVWMVGSAAEIADKNWINGGMGP
jgi:hypothetical protein